MNVFAVLIGSWLCQNVTGKNCSLKGSKFFPVRVKSSGSGANCCQLNIDYIIHSMPRSLGLFRKGKIVHSIVGLTLKVPNKNCSRRHFNFAQLLSFEENKAWFHMWILCKIRLDFTFLKGDNHCESSALQRIHMKGGIKSPIFYEKQ